MLRLLQDVRLKSIRILTAEGRHVDHALVTDADKAEAKRRRQLSSSDPRLNLRQDRVRTGEDEHPWVARGHCCEGTRICKGD